MSNSQAAHPGESRLRFVFGDSVVSFHRTAGVTLGEIARTLDELPSHRYGPPVAIDLTLSPRRKGSTGSPKAGWSRRPI